MQRDLPPFLAPGYDADAVPAPTGAHQGKPMNAAMREALEANGALGPVKAQLRAAIFHSIDGSTAEAVPRPAPTPEALLVHELFREYLMFAGFQHTLSVFASEANLAEAAPPRRLMADQVGVGGTPADIPLIFGMLAECAGVSE